MNAENCIPIELTDTKQYLRLLCTLQKETAYIQLVQICGEDECDPVLVKAKELMKLIKKEDVNRWLGTISRGQKVPQYLFQANNFFFNYLKGFPSFFFNTKDKWGCDEVTETAFGQDDIAFLDHGRRVLFYTTTHEGYAYADPLVISEKSRTK